MSNKQYHYKPTETPKVIANDKTPIENKSSELEVVENAIDLSIKTEEVQTDKLIAEQMENVSMDAHKDIDNFSELTEKTDMPVDRQRKLQNITNCKPAASPGRKFSVSQNGTIAEIETMINKAEISGDRFLAADLHNLLILVGNIRQHLKEMERKFGSTVSSSINEKIFK